MCASALCICKWAQIKTEKKPMGRVSIRFAPGTVRMKVTAPATATLSSHTTTTEQMFRVCFFLSHFNSFLFVSNATVTTVVIKSRLRFKFMGKLMSRCLENWWDFFAVACIFEAEIKSSNRILFARVCVCCSALRRTAIHLRISSIHLFKCKIKAKTKQ